MSGGGEIELVGLDKVLQSLKATDAAVCEAAVAGLEDAGANIIADAVQNIRNNHSWTTGALAQSAHVERKGDEVTAGFFDTENTTGYALYVEFGRRAGKMPPPDTLAAWAYKKFQLKDWRAATALGWAMARTIARVGTQPHPFFVPAVNKNTKGSDMKGVPGAVAKRIMKILRNSTARFAAEGRRIRNTPIDN